MKLKIIQRLADGINPITGEVFDYNHILQNGIIVRALVASVKAIENDIKKEKRKKLCQVMPDNLGQKNLMI